MENEVSILLKEDGLNEKEIKVYLYLAGNMELTGYKIAKETKIHRSTCYDILEKLINKGFVNKIQKKDKNYYSVNEISKIISSLRGKEIILTELIPRLQRIEMKQETNIKFLENPESQKEFNIRLFDLMKKNKISFVYVLGNGPSIMESLNLLLERLIREAKTKRIHKKINYKGIWNLIFKTNKYQKIYSNLGKKNNKFLKDIPTKVTIIIFDDHIAFLYTSFNNPYVIEIKNKLIAEEMKSYFNHLWKLAKSNSQPL